MARALSIEFPRDLYPVTSRGNASQAIINDPSLLEIKGDVNDHHRTTEKDENPVSLQRKYSSLPSYVP
jgi:hypothetical protein